MLSTFNRLQVIVCLMCYFVLLLQLQVAYVHAEDHDHEAIIKMQDGQEHLVFHHSSKLHQVDQHDDDLGIAAPSQSTPSDHEIYFPQTHVQRSTTSLGIHHASQPMQFVPQHIGPLSFVKDTSVLFPSPPILSLSTTVLLI